MAYDYDALYGSTPDALGAPTQIFVDFFRTYPGRTARVLDIGCGQGRDALFIARLGHSVTGVDLSPNGIRDLNAAATRQGLAITGITADITAYTPDGLFDIILIDRTLHMLDTAPRHRVLARLLDHLALDGDLLIADEPSNIAGFRQTILAHPATWHETFAKSGTLFLKKHTNATPDAVLHP